MQLRGERSSGWPGSTCTDRRVLTAIGAEQVGHATFSSSAARLGETGTAARTAITRGLDVLRNRGITCIDTPFGSKAGTRMTLYRIEDPYLRLWFRFVEPHLAPIARGRSDLAIRAFEQSWTTWRGGAVEPVIRDALTRLGGSRPELASVEQVGGWWNRDNSTEVDLVAGTRKSVAIIGSIKWRERKAFNSDELRSLTSARAVVTEAASAKLLAICPAGLRPGTTPDLGLGGGRATGRMVRPGLARAAVSLEPELPPDLAWSVTVGLGPTFSWLSIPELASPPRTSWTPSEVLAATTAAPGDT